MRSLILAIIACLLVLVPAAQAQSKNPYSVAIKVNDKAITYFEIDQRIKLLKALGSNGDLKELAEKQLIEERLRLQAAEAIGISVADTDLVAGVDEFAARGKLTGEQLYEYLDERGADPSALNDFVAAGMVWRGVVQARFGAKANVSDEEIDVTLNLSSDQVQESVLMSEIQMSLDDNNTDEVMDIARKLSYSIRTTGTFATAARKYSDAPSAAQDGRLDWIPVANLPPVLAGQILALKPGEVTAPITLAQTIGIFQLRAVRTESTGARQPVTLTYTSVPIPAGTKNPKSEAASLMADVDTCADLRAESERFGLNRFTDHSSDNGKIPSNIAAVLESLDRHEAATYTSSANTLSVVMVCDRLRELPDDARDNIRNSLFNSRISAFGQGYLQELQGDAVIVYQ